MLHNFIEEESSGPNNSPQRPQRARIMPAIFDDFEMNTNDAMTDEGDLVQIALMANSELLSESEALKHTVWK